jgi:lipopolysaccharide heptosyltransferase II
MSLGLLEALRRRFPAARLHVLTGPWNRELFSSCGCADQVHVMDVTRFSRSGGLRWATELVRWGWRLRRLRLDVAIDVRGEFPHALLLWLSGARRRVGWACGGGGFLLTDRVPYVAGRHEVLSRAAIAGQLGVAPTDAPSPRIQPAPSDVQWADDQFRAAWRAGEQGQSSGPIVAIHLGAGTPAKRWPAESWRELAERLVREHTARIVLVGTAEDREAAKTITAADFHVLNLVGRLSLPKLAAVLRRADLFIGADSGPAHVAAAVGTRVLALFSGTNDPPQWMPCGPRITAVRHAPACTPCHREVCAWSDHPCMRGLTVEKVQCAAERTLELAGLQAGGLPAISRRSRSAPPVRGASDTCTPEGCQHPFGVASRLVAVRVLRWLLAGWMALVAATYLWHMLAGLGS